MKKKEIQNEYKKKLKLIFKLNKFYFNKSQPIVSDKEYDDLKKEIILLEDKYEFLKSKISPSKIVGHKPSKNFKKSPHRVQMLSLANAFLEEDLVNFEKKINNFLSKENDFKISYSAEPKIDGISASLTYKNGNFVKGLSRGDGKEGEDITGNSMDTGVLMPLNFGRNIMNARNADPMIMVKAKEGLSKSELKDELRGVMRSIRKLKPRMSDDFALNEISVITNALDSVFSVIGMGGWVIGGFSILVGGFGIANIMFVSVKERTKMIGIQKALGAKNNFILMQFLLESVILCMIGGILGLILVFVLVTAGSNMSDFSIQLSLENVVLGLSVSIIIGIISGIVPALSAARLDPVEAIRR